MQNLFQMQKKILLNLFLSEKEEWLNSEGSESTFDKYEKNLNELKYLGDPLKKREEENRKRPPLVSTLLSTISNFKAFKDNTEANFSHITVDDRKHIIEECEKTEKWLTTLIEKQNKIGLNVDPVLLTTDLIRKNDQLINACNAIKFKAKPKEYNADKSADDKKDEKKSDDKKSDEKKSDEKKSDDKSNDEKSQDPMDTENTETKPTDPMDTEN